MWRLVRCWPHLPFTILPSWMPPNRTNTRPLLLLVWLEPRPWVPLEPERSGVSTGAVPRLPLMSLSLSTVSDVMGPVPGPTFAHILQIHAEQWGWCPVRIFHGSRRCERLCRMRRGEERGVLKIFLFFREKKVRLSLFLKVSSFSPVLNTLGRGTQTSSCSPHDKAAVVGSSTRMDTCSWNGARWHEGIVAWQASLAC